MRQNKTHYDYNTQQPGCRIGVIMTGSIHDNRVLFDDKCVEIFSKLPNDSRNALAQALREFRAYAIEQAEVSQKKGKYMMYAYWRVLAVYARHITKFINKAKE